jgi:hypothetical protein
MVGTTRLELLTSIVSMVPYVYLQQTTWSRETAKYPQERLAPLNRGLERWGARYDFSQPEPSIIVAAIGTKYYTRSKQGPASLNGDKRRMMRL